MTFNHSTPLTRWGMPLLASLSIAACGNSAQDSTPAASSSPSSSSVSPSIPSSSPASSLASSSSAPPIKSSSSMSSSSMANATQDLPLIIAINAGSTAKATYNGIDYQGDKYSTGGTTYETTDAISGVSEDKLFQTQRYGAYSYKIPVLPGTYTIDLHLAEQYHNGSGLRTFDLSVEDKIVLNDLDLYSQVGHDGAYNYTVDDISISDGILDITVTPSQDQGTLSGFAIYSANGGIDTSAPKPIEPKPVNTNCKGYVGITYDDGPANTNAFVHALKSSGLTPVTFFVNGNRIKGSADIQAMLSVGEVQSHAFTHDNLSGASTAQVTSSLKQNNDAVVAAGAPKPTIFRPPYGANSANIRSAAASLGMIVITWTHDSKDWNGASTANIVNSVKGLNDGDVILMHENQTKSLSAIPQIAQALKSKGLCPGRLDPKSAGKGRAIAP